ncbi:MAG: glycosyltransferase family 1 protein [Eubacteriaceae bacterium]|nr:glycosyltransferase family 1 protein [Eubacteriaceae bacterium]
MPSLFEGLPLTGIEAQVSGVPCIFSSNISPQVVISPACKLMDITNPETWGEQMGVFIDSKRERSDLSRISADSGYDINDAIKVLEDIYSKAGNAN